MRTPLLADSHSSKVISIRIAEEGLAFQPHSQNGAVNLDLVLDAMVSSSATLLVHPLNIPSEEYGPDRGESGT